MGFSAFDVHQLESAGAVLLDDQVADEISWYGGDLLPSRALLSLVAATDDTVNSQVDIYVAMNTSFPRKLMSVTVPAGSGYAGMPAVDLLLGLTWGVIGFPIIAPGDDWGYALHAAPSTGKTVALYAIVGYF